MKETGKINYVEIPARGLEATKRFFVFSTNLEATLEKVELSGGKVVKNIFSFPGGRRFHFSDPNGNEYAVWSEPNA